MSKIEETYYIHKKTGYWYVVVGTCTDATNATEGREMVIYTSVRTAGAEGIENLFYVREKQEFLDKFYIPE